MVWGDLLMCHVYLSQEFNKTSENPASFSLLLCHMGSLIHPMVIVSDSEQTAVAIPTVRLDAHHLTRKVVII